MRVAAIFPVGTSVGGAPDAIAEILSHESALDVHLLYGEPGNRPRELRAGLFSDPKEAVEAIRREVRDTRIHWGECRMVHSFEFATTYREIRDFIGEIRDHYGRVYVGITGGTNPMNVSLFQAAMAYLHTEVVPLYVQAHGADWQSNFVASEIRDRVAAEDALRAARTGQIQVAAVLAQSLPATAQWKFLLQSLTALSHWDDFDYQQASHSLEQQARKSGEYAGHDLLGGVAETVARIARNAVQTSEFTGRLRDTNGFDARASASGWVESVEENGLLVVADALANAARRLQEHRYTDSVLRSYRAAECATQMRLLKIGIHPARPNAYRPAFERYASPELAGERPLAFEQGLQFLKSSGQLWLDPSTEKSVRALQNERNHTYLEHGYVRIQCDQAQRCFERSLEICGLLLEPAITEKWREFEMRL